MGLRSLAVHAGVALAVALALALGTTGALAQQESATWPPDRCDRGSLVAGVNPPDARGTTFVGTYLGDSADGSGPMMSSWSVERVYAGGPLPRDLVFQTPACSWTNLTPGVRYLFSTAVTDLEWASPDAGQPSVADSLAWELLSGDAVRLAPFDTYVAGDYASDELHAITTFEDALWSVAPDASDGSAPDAPLDPAFGCPASWFTASPEDARGTTFVGVYVGDQRLPGPSKDDVRTFWALERVYAGGPLPEVLTMRSDGCGPTTLEAGRRYLFSTADPLAPAAWNSLAWELGAEDTARLAPFGRLKEDEYPSAARAIASLDAALSNVAPGAVGGEVPLRAADRTPG